MSDTREWAGTADQIERLTRERDEARAEVRALCGEPEALDPLLPRGWIKRRGYAYWHRTDFRAVVDCGHLGASWREMDSNKAIIDLRCGNASTLLLAMHAADEALAGEGE